MCQLYIVSSFSISSHAVDDAYVDNNQYPSITPQSHFCRTPQYNHIFVALHNHNHSQQRHHTNVSAVAIPKYNIFQQ